MPIKVVSSQTPHACIQLIDLNSSYITEEFGVKFFFFFMVLYLSFVIVNIDGYWRFIWSLILGFVEISQGACKLIQIPRK
jgi:hypothetical protein